MVRQSTRHVLTDRPALLNPHFLGYPAASVPYHESSLFDGYPDETGAPYGVAKRALVAQARAYRRQ